MPQYVVQCLNEECKHQFDIRCKYSEVEETKCPLCTAKLKIVPVPGGMIKVNGYSEANGYHRENLNYDGSDRQF